MQNSCVWRFHTQHKKYLNQKQGKTILLLSNFFKKSVWAWVEYIQKQSYHGKRRWDILRRVRQVVICV